LGTGPYIVDRVVPRERLEARRNGEYWEVSGRPRHDRLALLPMPDSLTRVAALLSNQVDFIEAPPPDAVPRLRSAGFQVPTNAYPHIWCHQLSHLPDSPFRDLRVRQAANLAINRDGLVTILGGLALPAKGMVNDNHPWFGSPSFEIKYDPDHARRLLAQAGFSRAYPLRTKFIVAPSGSGQMQPMPMNEAIQQDFRAVGIELEFEVMDWEALRARRRASAEGAENRGMHAINNSWGFWDPNIGLLGPAYGRGRVIGGFNWGNYQDAQADDLCEQARRTFDVAEQNRILARLHTRLVDQAMRLWAVHDVNPRGLSRRVQGFSQVQGWYQDLTPIRMG